MIKSKKNVIFVIIIAILITSIYVYKERYTIQFYYLMWRADNFPEPGLFYYSEKTEDIAPHILPHLVSKYGDIRTSTIQRAIVGNGLIKADKKIAKELFIKYLSNSDNDIVAHSIFGLAKLDDQSQYDKVLKFVDSPDWYVRQAVIRYLKGIDSEDSINILNNMMINDPDEHIRTIAKDVLSDIKAMPNENRKQ
jgi:HEAT repeat protein